MSHPSRVLNVLLNVQVNYSKKLYSCQYAKVEYNQTMPENLRQLLSDLKAGLRQLYPQRLRGVYLFGSYARGDQDPESDLDILIVLSDYERYSAEIGRTGDLISKLSLQAGVSISRIFMTENEYRSADTPLLRNVRIELIAL